MMMNAFYVDEFMLDYKENVKFRRFSMGVFED
jgi:hypothetical protein